jgi:hypothetical protein
LSTVFRCSSTILRRGVLPDLRRVVDAHRAVGDAVHELVVRIGERVLRARVDGHRLGALCLAGELLVLEALAVRFGVLLVCLERLLLPELARDLLARGANLGERRAGLWPERDVWPHVRARRLKAEVADWDLHGPYLFWELASRIQLSLACWLL